MQLTTKCRYAVHCLSQLANQKNNQPLSLHTLSDDLELSFKYLENIFAVLKQGEIVTSTRGAKGGYQLTKQPKKITLYDIYLICETNTSIVDADQKQTAMQKVLEKSLWNKVDNNIKKYLKSVTLYDVAKGKVSVN